MSWRRASVTVVVCFVLGVLVAPTIQEARACSCQSFPFWKLTLESIDGEADAAAEEAYWESEMWLNDFGQTGSTEFNTRPGVELRRVP